MAGLRDAGEAKDTLTINIKKPRADMEDFSNPDGSPVTITVYGPFSEHYRKTRRALERELAEGKGVMTDAQREEAVDMLMRRTLERCVKDWNFTLDSGPKAQKEPFAPEKVSDIFAEMPWLYEQVEAQFWDNSNFLGKPEKG